MDDELIETLEWLSNVVYLHTIIKDHHTNKETTVKDNLIKKWSNPNYILSKEEEKLFNIILGEEIEDGSHNSI